MRKIKPEQSNLPFSNEKLKEILENIYKVHEEEIGKLEDEVEICREHIFDNITTSNLEDGFMIAVCFKKLKSELSCSIEEITLFDNEDEWFTEFKRLQKLKE